MYSNDSSPTGETIGDRQRRIEAALRAMGEMVACGKLPKELEALSHLAPRPGSTAHVVLHHSAADDPAGVGRDIADDAGAHDWAPIPGYAARLWYQGDPARQASAHAESVHETPAPVGGAFVQGSLSRELGDLVRELDRAVRCSGKPYIVFGYFRDTWLVSAGLPWVGAKKDPTGISTRQRVLSEAIERGMVTTRKVPNPMKPGEQSTTIDLERAHPGVAEILGHTPQLPEFRPVPIRGELLSETIIRERRQR